MILCMLLAELLFLRNGTSQTLSWGSEAPGWKENPVNWQWPPIHGERPVGWAEKMVKSQRSKKLWKWDLGDSYPLSDSAHSTPLGGHSDVGRIRLKHCTFDSCFPFMCERLTAWGSTLFNVQDQWQLNMHFCLIFTLAGLCRKNAGFNEVH